MQQWLLETEAIKVGETIFAEEAECKVRALFDDKGKIIKEVLPGEPAKVFGFTEVPLWLGHRLHERHTKQSKRFQNPKEFLI